MSRLSKLLSRSVLLAVACGCTLASTARAQDLASFPVERFHPSLDREGFFGVEGAQVPKHLEFDVSLFAGYALNPLVVKIDNGSGAQREGALVSHRVGANLVGQISLLNVFELGLDVPLILFQAADAGDALVGAKDLSAVGIGDLRLVPKAQLLRARDRFVDLSVSAAFTLPTNFPQGSFGGDSFLTFAPAVEIGRNFLPHDALRVDGNLGVRLRRAASIADLDVGQELNYDIAARYSLQSHIQQPIAVGVVLSGSSGLDKPFSNLNQNPLEALLGATYDVWGPLQASLGVGAGIIAGYGTPDLRVVAGMRWSPRDDDLDDDGIKDVDDACPAVAEDKDAFEDSDGCLEPDNDKDGVLDGVDGAPNDPEDVDAFRDSDGVPDPDNDQDGTLDGDDKCPLLSGPADNGGCPWPDSDGDTVLDKDDACVTVPGDPATRGCPDKDKDGTMDADDACVDVPGPKAFKGCPDTDGDGLTDNVDKCPTEPETINGVEDTDGCPDKGQSLVTLTKEKIEILDKVYFDRNKATIQPRSFGLLDQVASVLKNNLQITKVRVEGHTDSDGSDASNLDLSQRRTESVRQRLIKAGVDAARLDAMGFGETRPVAPNDTKVNKEKNRRVEFSIIEVDGKPVEATDKTESKTP